MDDDASSVSSYMDGIPPPPGAAQPSWDGRGTTQETLKINGKVPDVLHVIEYVGSRRRILHGKSLCFQPLCFQPLYMRQSLT
jgi:hypothetical protein